MCTPRACLFATVFLLLPISVGCSISEQQELELGRQSHAQFEKQFGGLYPDARVQQYVNSVGLRLARYGGRPQLDWQYAVVNSNQVNAFAVPGGYVYITRGLLFRMENEAQLAGVLGHESAHVALRHSVKQIERARATQGVASVAGFVGALFGYSAVGDVTGIVGSLALMKYSRDQEKQADLNGLKYMTEAGYNPQGMVQTMKILQSATGGGRGPPEFLASHPNPGNRVEYLTREIEQKYAEAARNGELGEQNFRAIIGRSSVGATLVSPSSIVAEGETSLAPTIAPASP